MMRSGRRHLDRVRLPAAYVRVLDLCIINHSNRRERLLKREGVWAPLHRHWCTQCRGSQLCMNQCGHRRRIRPGEPSVLNDLFEVCLSCRGLKEAVKRFDSLTMKILILQSHLQGSDPLNGVCWN